MRKRILALLLAAVMTVGLLPTAAFAEEEELPHTHDETFTGTSSLPDGEGSYYLTGNVELYEAWAVPSGKDIKLCLNGHSITQTAESASVIRVEGEGSLTLYDCSTDTPGKITGGKGGGNGGGVYVCAGATFTMNGGEISGNKATSGGGVYVGTDGTFTMNGGKISGNEATNGGGVYVDAPTTGSGVNEGGTFTMDGGEISGNKATSGGGVYVGRDGTFTMNGGKISGNEATYGGGVYVDEPATGSEVDEGGTFIMKGGTISGNRASAFYSGGGGVYVRAGAAFTMNGGTISGNTAESGSGGGVCLKDGVIEADGISTIIGGTFTMDGGTISGNTATGNGGGVDVGPGTTFTMNDGAISGNTAADGGGVNVRYGGFGNLDGTSTNAGGTFNMTGGTITQNTATSGSFGGVEFADYTRNLTLSGSCQIYGNTPSNLRLFVWQYAGGPLMVTNPFTDEARVGVNVSSTGIFTSGWEENKPDGGGLVFFDDNPDNTQQKIIEVETGGKTELAVAFPVRFNAVGGIPEPEAQYLLEDSEVEKPSGDAEPKKDGYTLDGWYNDSYTNKWNFDTDIASSSRTLYAKWIANEYKVNFDLQDGSEPRTETFTYTGNRGEITEPDEEPTREGYIFLGWFKDEGFEEPWDFENDTVLNTDRVTLYAGWMKSTCTVTFDSQGGSDVDSQTVPAGGKLTKPSPDPTRKGYTFSGWYLRIEDEGETFEVEWPFDNDEYNVVDPYAFPNMTLYAKWTENIHDISGKVTDSGDNPVEGVTVKLMQGNAEKGTFTTEADGEYSFSGVKPGVYSVVVTKGEKTMTRPVTVPDTQSTGDPISGPAFEMPDANVSSVLNVEGEDTPAVAVDGLGDAAVEEANKSENSSAASVTVTMTVESKEEDAADNASDIKAEAGESKKLEYLEIKVEKTVTTTENGTATTETSDIHTTTNPLIILVPYEFTGKTDVVVYRYHDTAEALDKNPAEGSEGYELDEDNGFIMICSKKFSTYAIGYTPADPVDPVDPPAAPEDPVDPPADPEDPVKYTLTVNGGTIDGGTGSGSYTAGTVVSISATIPSGQQFTNWTGAAVADADSASTTLTMPAEDTTVTANFQNISGSGSGGGSGGGSSGGGSGSSGSSGGGGGGGGGGYSPSVFPVNVPGSIPNGAVSVSPQNAGVGTTVTITVTPEKGYEISSVTVTDKDGKGVPLTSKGNGKYTFIMPVGKVAVSASFVKIGGGYAGCLRDYTCLIWTYIDASAAAWYHDGVHYCIENGLMSGYDGNTFGPGDDTSRAIIATILWRLEGSPVVNYAMPFDDVAEGMWYTEAVRWAVASGVVGGYGDGKFAPDDPITREQLAAMLYRYEQHKGGGFTGAWMFPLNYADAEMVSSWAYEPMCWATMNGIINGIGNGLLESNGRATRAQVATMIMRFCEKM